MKERRVIVIAVGLLVILSLVTVVWAQISTNFDLGWHVFGSGGGQSESANYKVQDTLGQWVGSISSCGRQRVQAGFWYGVPAPGTVQPQCNVFLPLVTRNLCTGGDTPDCATGPLVSGQTYQGCPDDQDDYYFINLNTTGTISATVSNFQATGDLILRDASLNNLVNWGKGGSTMSVSKSGLDPGRYYIRVYTASGFNCDSQYSLTATFP